MLEFWVIETNNNVQKLSCFGKPIFQYVLFRTTE